MPLHRFAGAIFCSGYWMVIGLEKKGRPLALSAGLKFCLEPSRQRKQFFAVCLVKNDLSDSKKIAGYPSDNKREVLSDSWSDKTLKLLSVWRRPH